MAFDPQAYQSFPEVERVANQAYWEHRAGGGETASPNSNEAARAEDPRHLRQSLEAVRQARETHADPEKIAWEKDFKQRVMDHHGLSETQAEAAAIMVSVTPVGIGLGGPMRADGRRQLGANIDGLQALNRLLL
ncbi:hypothetical protein [Magnetospira sp. QH-2]|uniref:hypothetical protein n=1 Tax=Magnetospira sp. (strain QH-2) TaxID=1288970 RepID=UPI0003E8107C|nr:hypothetical protein [Magnetospira sp. QH-2]CCQ75662.1 protein of unknown function [Magnetospira sp. QH-2]